MSRSRLSPAFDLRLTLQGRNATVDLSDLGVTNDALVIHGCALSGSGRMTVPEFGARAEAEVREKLEDYLTKGGIDFDTDDLIILDLEPPPTGGRHRQRKTRR